MCCEKNFLLRFYQCEGVCVHMYVCMCVREGVEVEIPIVMLGAGEGSVKIAPNGISYKYSV